MSKEQENANNENKVIFIGESAVGKTSLIKVSIGQKMDSQHLQTLTASYFPKHFFYNNQKFIFNLWDTIGQEKYRSLTRMFFKDSNIVILVYDITNKKSFEELDFWLKQVKEVIGDDFILAIVGNKSDLYLQEEVSEQQGKEYAEKICSHFKICSAKDNPNGFTKFLDELLEEYIVKYKKIAKIEPERLNIHKKSFKEKKKKKICC